ncbi:PIN domain-containing protein, partial [Elstera litoralis]|uniref:PIN domain-containing protein n=1 Tax=Elstera litoralis TaxID=552518 RepID=UPI001E4FD797
TSAVTNFLDYLAGLVEPVQLHYLWRPQLGDVADEMVLETAINGTADCIVTFNTRHFGPATRFGIEAIWPEEALRRIR